MDAKGLEKAGIILYGEHWRIPMARDLHIHVTTLWRYQKRDKIPRRVELAIEALLSARSSAQPHSRPT